MVFNRINRFVVLRSRSRKEPHHFGRARAGAVTQSDSGSCCKLDVKLLKVHRKSKKLVQFKPFLIITYFEHKLRSQSESLSRIALQLHHNDSASTPVAPATTAPAPTAPFFTAPVAPAPTVMVPTAPAPVVLSGSDGSLSDGSGGYVSSGSGSGGSGSDGYSSGSSGSSGSGGSCSGSSAGYFRLRRPCFRRLRWLLLRRLWLRRLQWLRISGGFSVSGGSGSSNNNYLTPCGYGSATLISILIDKMSLKIRDAVNKRGKNEGTDNPSLKGHIILVKQRTRDAMS
jgi:hypothetical protein